MAQSLDGGRQISITEFDFVLTPLELVVPERRGYEYCLELRKGPQIWTAFSRNYKHQMGLTSIKANGEQGRVRFQSQARCECEWVVYSKAADSRAFVARIPFDVGQLYHKYLLQLRKHVTFVDELISTKDPQGKWEEFKHRMRWEWDKLEATKDSITIKYRLQICNALDSKLVQQFEEEEEIVIVDSEEQEENKKKQESIKVNEAQQQDNDMPKINLLPETSKFTTQDYSELELTDDMRDLLLPVIRIHQAHSVDEEDEEEERANNTYTYQHIHNNGHNEVLSDIIEDSKESQSQRGHHQKTLKLQSVQLIPEQQSQESPLLNTRTQDFINVTKDDSGYKKRCNTFTTIKKEDEKDIKSESDKVHRIFHSSSEDQQLEKQELRQAGLETAPQSTIESMVKYKQSSQATKPEEKSLVFKVMVGLIIFLVVFGFLGAIAKSIESGGPFGKSKKGRKEPKANARHQPRPQMAERSNKRLSKGAR